MNIQKVQETTRQVTVWDGTVLDTITTLWGDGTYSVYAEHDSDYIYARDRVYYDPLMDDYTYPPSDEDISSAYEGAQGW